MEKKYLVPKRYKWYKKKIDGSVIINTKDGQSVQLHPYYIAYIFAQMFDIKMEEIKWEIL